MSVNMDITNIKNSFLYLYRNLLMYDCLYITNHIANLYYVTDKKRNTWQLRFFLKSSHRVYHYKYIYIFL